MTGAELIAQERARQVAVEGWTVAHDDEHEFGELAWAAICYAAPGPVFKATSSGGQTFRDPWPWSREWDKRDHASKSGLFGKDLLDRRARDLVKAGALIAAEIDRVERARAEHERTK